MLNNLPETGEGPASSTEKRVRFCTHCGHPVDGRISGNCPACGAPIFQPGAATGPTAVPANPSSAVSGAFVTTEKRSNPRDFRNGSIYCLALGIGFGIAAVVVLKTDPASGSVFGFLTLAAIFLLLSRFFYRVYQYHAFRYAGHCPKCGYSLVATTGNRCPECGNRFRRVIRIAK